MYVCMYVCMYVLIYSVFGDMYMFLCEIYKSIKGGYINPIYLFYFIILFCLNESFQPF